MTQPRKRLSVSAIRDYNKCARFYYYKRVRKLPDPMSHHAPAGTTVHNSFYAAYGKPTIQVSLAGSGEPRMKTIWYVHGNFEPDMALATFDLFWNRHDQTDAFDHLTRHLRDPALLQDDERLSRLREVYDTLSPEMPVLKNNFRPGQLKSLGKGQKLTQTQLKNGWGDYYREMLAGVLAQPLPFPVKEIEREYTWLQDGVEMIGYADIVLDKGGNKEAGLDLKTAYNKPSEKELPLEDQMLGYYEASFNQGFEMEEFYYWHLRSNEKYLVKDDPQLRAFLRATAVQVSNRIHAGDWTPRFDKENCAMCTFQRTCVKEPHVGSPYETPILTHDTTVVPVVLF